MKVGETRNRHWSINGRFLNRAPTGVDRYAREIISAIDRLISEGHPLTAKLELEILSPAGEVSSSPFVNVPLRLLPSAPGHLWEQFILPWHICGGLLSLANTGPLTVTKQIVCIHDVNTRLAPESYGKAFRTLYRFLQPALARRVARITTVSHFSQQALGRFRIAMPDEVAVIHNGYEHVLEWSPNGSSLKSVDLSQQFVLLVGSAAPHKNVAIIYSIAPELARRGLDVVVIGGGNKTVYASERSAELASNVRHLGRISDDDLAFLYQKALCLVFPSRTEGFGLPALEAMALGCPVITSDAASLPEVCGEAGLYACPDEPAGWLRAIGRIADEPTFRTKLAIAGRERAKAFTWRKGGEQYLELMFALDHETVL